MHGGQHHPEATTQKPPPALLCGDTNLQLLATSANAKCAAALPGTDAFCGIVNPTDGTVAPWSFTDKSGFHTYLNGEFYEGGINLSTLGLGNECFSSVLSETRASTSTTATLKDFVLGQFAVCSATLTTTPSVGAGTEVLPGQSVNDIATVQGLGTGSPPTPTGNVTFHMCGPTDPSSTATCDTGGALVSTNALADSSPPAGEAQATSDNVNTAASPLAPGRYCFRADWPGDSNYIQEGGFSHSGTGNSECFIVRQLATTTVTTPSVGAGPVAVGTSVTDHAVVTGTAAGGTPTGTINFFVCNPTQVATNGGTCSTGGTAAGSKTAVAGPGANQSQADSDAVTASSVGTWCFRAVYVPDTNVYTGSQDASTGECFLVQDSSSASSEQDWLPNDTAHVATAGGTALNGTLTIALHLSSDCSGPVVAGQSYSSTLTNAASPVTRSTSNTTFLVTADATVSWSVDFAPTAGSNVTGSSHCETSTVTITN